MNNNEIQRIRLNYLPKDIKVLFIGESPPIGNTFFYKGRSVLFNSTREVFEKFYNKDFSDSFYFLEFFKDSGFFLDDLCHSPINHIKDSALRNKLRDDGILGLKNRLEIYRPKRIISVMKDPYFNMCIDEAINLAGIDVNIKYSPLPFPRYNKYVIQYKLTLREYLENLRNLEII